MSQKFTDESAVAAIRALMEQLLPLLEAAAVYFDANGMEKDEERPYRYGRQDHAAVVETYRTTSDADLAGFVMNESSWWEEIFEDQVSDAGAEVDVAIDFADPMNEIRRLDKIYTQIKAREEQYKQIDADLTWPMRHLADGGRADQQPHDP